MLGALDWAPLEETAPPTFEAAPPKRLNPPVGLFSFPAVDIPLGVLVEDDPSALGELLPAAGVPNEKPVLPKEDCPDGWLGVPPVFPNMLLAGFAVVWFVLPKRPPLPKADVPLLGVLAAEELPKAGSLLPVESAVCVLVFDRKENPEPALVVGGLEPSLGFAPEAPKLNAMMLEEETHSNSYERCSSEAR